MSKVKVNVHLSEGFDYHWNIEIDQADYDRFKGNHGYDRYDFYEWADEQGLLPKEDRGDNCLFEIAVDKVP